MTLARRGTFFNDETICAAMDELRNGDRMTQAEFHRIYLATPEDFRAELIGGIVYLPSRTTRRHGASRSLLGYVLGLYAARTPNVEALTGTTVLLGDMSEPQPDLLLRVLPDRGGRSQTTPDGDYVLGAPELVIEIAYSGHSIELHAKRDDYAHCGVIEYAVWIVKDGVFGWFDLGENVEQSLTPENVIRSFTFPGLWIDGGAVRAGDLTKLTATLEAGLATPEHAAFVKRLAEAKQ